MPIPRFEFALARAVTELPARSDLAWEPKWDGYRAAAVVDGTVSLRSRRGTALGPVFPEIGAAVAEHFPPLTAVDGELVRWQDGRLDFELLGRRFAAGPRRARELAAEFPAHLVVFDLLWDRGRDLRHEPLRERRRSLEALMAEVPAASALTLCPQTTDLEVAREWLSTLPAAGIEGVVGKSLGAPYPEGRRDWIKVKTFDSLDLIVGAVTGTLHEPDRLVLGRYTDEGVLRIVATSAPLPPAVRDQVTALLVPAGPDHPWPEDIHLGWGRPPTSITRVEPRLVVEVAADPARSGHRIRHLVKVLRLRIDLEPMRLPRLADEG